MATQQQPQAQGREQAQDTGQRSASIARKEETSPTRAETSRAGRFGGPYSLARRLSEEMDRLLDDFFLRGPFGASLSPFDERERGELSYWPPIEVTQEGTKFVVVADVPGLRKQDVKVEVSGNELSISGERRAETEHPEAEYYRSERSYGSFCRTIALPDDADVGTTSASFENGVLKVEIEVPGAERTRPRQIEIRDSSVTH